MPMDVRSNPDDARSRRRFRPRLWWLMILVLLCALGFGWWVQVERQRRAMEMAMRAAMREREVALVERMRADQFAMVAAAQAQQSGSQAGQADKAQQIQALKDEIAKLEAKLKVLEAQANP
jgi:hypothetical protein